MTAKHLLALFGRISEATDAIPRLRQFILELAVRGRLVEQNQDDEPASEQLERMAEAAALRRPRAVSLEQSISLPNGWTPAKLADLVTVLNGRAYSKNELLDSGTPVLRVGNLFTSKQWYYSNLTLEPDKYCDTGDLLFAWSASFGPFIWTGPKVIYHYHIWKLRLHSIADLNKLYLYRFLQHATEEIRNSGHGVSMLHMTKEKMERLSVPLPPLAEQQRIVAKVDELMALCDRLKAAQADREATRDRLAAASVHHLNNGENPEAFRKHAQFYINYLPRLTARPEQIKQLRQTILNLAVRGKLVPQDPRDECAKELIQRIKADNPAFRELSFERDAVCPFSIPAAWG
jgi:type I restriction enzyme S subunit